MKCGQPSLSVALSLVEVVVFPHALLRGQWYFGSNSKHFHEFLIIRPFLQPFISTSLENLILMTERCEKVITNAQTADTSGKVARMRMSAKDINVLTSITLEDLKRSTRKRWEWL